MHIGRSERYFSECTQAWDECENEFAVSFDGSAAIPDWGMFLEVLIPVLE